MRKAIPVVAFLILAAASTTTLANPVQAADSAVRAAVQQLLDRYSRNDSQGVVALLDPEGFVIYGSDAAEKVQTSSDLLKLMDADFRLWKSASFGEVGDLSIVSDGKLATAYFHVPFTAGGNPPVLVRFSTTWRKVSGAWKLRQSANTVPTVGMSASQLAK